MTAFVMGEIRKIAKDIATLQFKIFMSYPKYVTYLYCNIFGE